MSLMGRAYIWAGRPHSRTHQPESCSPPAHHAAPPDYILPILNPRRTRQRAHDGADGHVDQDVGCLHLGRHPEDEVQRAGQRGGHVQQEPWDRRGGREWRLVSAWQCG